MNLALTGKDLETTPILYAETINGKTYICQATSGCIAMLDDVQELPESFNIELKTQSDVGVFIGTFPILD